MRPKVSVAMATYNGEKYIKEQIKTILDCLEENDELVISDDGSTDNSFLICEKYKKFLVNMNKSQNFLSW